VVEARERRVTHAEMGAYLLGEWGLPHEIVEAVAYHHSPGRTGTMSPSACTFVHVADALAYEVAPDAGGPPPVLDEHHLLAVGLHDRLGEWRLIATEEADAVVAS
jgi:HD-like signal output (HDOD) protein